MILPVDQGLEHGPARSFAPNPSAESPLYFCRLAVEAGCNAFAAPLGLLEAGAREFAGKIPLIPKINDHDLTVDEEDPTQALTGTVAAALRLGCCAIGFTIHPGSSQRLHRYTQIRSLAEEAKRYGRAMRAVRRCPRRGRPPSTSSASQPTSQPSSAPTSSR